MREFIIHNSEFRIARVFLALFFTLITYNLSLVTTVHADTVIDNGLSFLKSKQDSTGRINTGFSAPSQWSAIAFASQGIDVSTIKNPTASLKDFLLSDAPSDSASATDIENRILAIVATGSDPTNFGGVNYVQKLEGFYNNKQIGDACALNDDIFGLLALIASGTSSSTQIKQDVLKFLISKQDPTDNGFGFSAPGCEYYSTASDMTGAAIQALVAAKINGLSDPGLDKSITKATSYILENQNGDGGFGYFGASDTDTTGWVLMALNALGFKDSQEAINAKKWLTAQQSANDGGFLAFDYGTNIFVSNSTTTAQAIIALSGKSWILKIFAPIVNPSPTSTLTPTLTITPTPSPSPTPSPTPTPTVTAAPVTINHYITTYYPQNTKEATQSAVTNITKYLPDTDSKPATPFAGPAPAVLGETIKKSKTDMDKSQLLVRGLDSISWPLAFVFSLYFMLRFMERRYKK